MISPLIFFGKKTNYIDLTANCIHLGVKGIKITTHNGDSTKI